MDASIPSDKYLQGKHKSFSEDACIFSVRYLVFICIDIYIHMYIGTLILCTLRMVH